MISKKNFKRYLGELAVIGLGAFLFSMSLNMFLLPAKIILGGLTGVATVLNLFFGTPVGLMIIVLNIPLIIANACYFGRGFLGRTIVGLAATSVASDIITGFPVTETDPLLCSILGGAVMGASVGLLLSKGYTTGGTDLAACLVKIKFKNVSTGNIIMMCDMIIILGAAAVTRNYGGILYSVICTWISGRVLDFMLSGAGRAGQVFIISEKTDELVKIIFERLDRGVTVISAIGGYTGAPKKVIMCALPKKELFFLKEIIKECDPLAFTVIADAAEVAGEGFVNRSAGQLTRKGSRKRAHKN